MAHMDKAMWRGGVATPNVKTLCVGARASKRSAGH